MQNVRQIRIRGTHASWETLRSRLTSEFPQCLTVSDPEDPARGIVRREPMRQDPLVEFCINVFEHVAALGVFHLIQARIEEAQEKDHFIVLTGLRDSPTERREGNDH